MGPLRIADSIERNRQAELRRSPPRLDLQRRSECLDRLGMALRLVERRPQQVEHLGIAR